MKKQLDLPNIQKAERQPFVLDGEPGVVFNLRDPWPMPTACKPVPQKPLMAAWQRVKEAVKS